MLNITAQASPDGAKKYFARSDYYDGQDLVGQWGGRGAVLLGLRGQVEKAAFDRLCDNLDPKTGERLTQLTRGNRRVGYDFTWSAPKSVSVMHALTGDERIVQAFRESIAETMGEMEAEMQTRVRKGGEESDRTTGNFAYAEFLHLTSRPVDGMPCAQLHAHCFAFNATFDLAEERWKAGQFGKIKGDGFYWQAVQQARFANRLQELGYSVRRTKDAFEIDGVPDSVLKKFSLRTGQIERVAKELGITDPKAKARLGATTREAKDHSIPYPELVERWDRWLTPDERAALLAVSDGMTPKPVKGSEVEHVQFALDDSFARASVIEERRLLAKALRHGCGEVTPEGVRSELSRRRLLRREEDGRILVTTKEILAEERKMIGFAAAGRGTCVPLVSGGAVEFTDRELDQEQRAAVEMPLRSADRVVIIRGVAGTGKTRSTTELVRQIRGRGRPVAIAAPTVRAVGVLHEDGFTDAVTLARLLIDQKLQQQARGGFIVLDEAGLVGTESMNELFALAKDSGARIVLLGDRKQLASVERGMPLRVLEDMAGVKMAEITEIRRQSGAYREVAKLLSQGKAAEGLDMLDAMGWVKLMPVWDSYQPIARDYVDKLGNAKEEKRHREALIVCPTHAEGQKITDAVRAELRQRGMIGEDDVIVRRLVPLQWTEAQRGDAGGYGGEEILQFHRNSGPYKAGERMRAGDALPQLAGMKPKHFAVYGEATLPLAKNDMVRATAKGKTKDGRHTISNGSIYTVEGIDRNGDIVFTNGWTVSKDFGHLAHAYVNTAYAAQGRTVKHVLIAQSAESRPASSREAWYVAVSRGRQSATVYTDDRRQLRAAVTRSDPRMSAVELAAKPRIRMRRRLRRVVERARLAALIAAKRQAHEPVRQVPQREVGYAR